MSPLIKFGLVGVDRIEESQISYQGQDVGFHFTLLRQDKMKFGSGFHTNKNIARQIAFAEYFERDFVARTSISNECSDWGLDTHPTACGFAVGFNSRNTKIRSVFEATERWALSQWIDEKKNLDRFSVYPTTASQKYWFSFFEKTKTFKREFIFQDKDFFLPMTLCLFLGWSKKGVYLGSAVRGSLNDAIEHAALEAARHKIIFDQSRPTNHFPYNRINYFARHGDQADEIISEHRDSDWPTPRVRLMKNEKIGNIFVSRTIFEDWTPWEVGPVSRMLY